MIKRFQKCFHRSSEGSFWCSSLQQSAQQSDAPSDRSQSSLLRSLYEIKTISFELLYLTDHGRCALLCWAPKHHTGGQRAFQGNKMIIGAVLVCVGDHSDPKTPASWHLSLSGKPQHWFTCEGGHLLRFHCRAKHYRLTWNEIQWHGGNANFGDFYMLCLPVFIQW